MLYDPDGPPFGRGKKTHRIDGPERNRRRGHPSGSPTESLAPSVDLPVRIQLPHMDDSRGDERSIAVLSPEAL